MSTADKENYKAPGVVSRLMAAVDLEEGLQKGQSARNSDRATSPVSALNEEVPIAARLRALHMLVQGSDLGANVADEYRRIKRPLLSNAFGKTASLVDRGNLIMVTSSVPGEGKTYTSVNLALAIAQERDNTVLLVDCDSTRQGVSRMLGLQGRPGLVDVLEDENTEISDVLLRTDIPGLVVLPAGRQHDYIVELLASHRMSDLVDEISSRYHDRIVVFDVPPLLPTPQTQIMAGLVGQIVFVIETGRTPQSAVAEALEMIPAEKAIGLVLNKTEKLSSRGGYYYGYYDAYGEQESS